MNTISQGFFNNLTTSRTHLARVARAHKNHFPTGSFRLVGCELHELVPRYVTNTLVKFMSKAFCLIFYHVPDVKFFKHNHLVFFYQSAGKFMSKISSFIRYIFVDARHFLPLHHPVRTAFFRLTQSSLSLGEFGVTRFKESRVRDFFTSGERGKRCTTHVNTNLIIYHWKMFGGNFTREIGVPFIVHSAYSHRLDSACNIPMKLNFDIADILDIKFPVFQFNPISIGRKCDRIKSLFTFKSGESGSVASFYTPKECLKRFVKASQYILRSGKIKFSDTIMKATNFLKGIGLGVIVNIFAPLFVADNSLLKGAIIQKTSRIKHVVKRRLLRFTGKQSVFKGFTHSLAFLILNVFTNRCLANMPDASGVIASTPKRWQLTTQCREFFSKNATCVPLESIRYLCYTICRPIFNKQVDMIGHNFQGVNLKTKLKSFFSQQGFKSLSDIINKNLAPILWAPYKVNFQAEYGTTVFRISIHEQYYIYDKLLCQEKIMKGGHAFLCRLKTTVPSMH